jgi:hypothetical protein
MEDDAVIREKLSAFLLLPGAERPYMQGFRKPRQKAATDGSARARPHENRGFEIMCFWKTLLP